MKRFAGFCQIKRTYNIPICMHEYIFIIYVLYALILKKYTKDDT